MKVPCPLCGGIRCVNTIHTAITTNVIRARFCKDCLLEFRISGSIIPPVQIEKDLSGTAIPSRSKKIPLTKVYHREKENENQ